MEVFSFLYLYPRVLFPGKTQFSSSAPPGGLVIKTAIHPLNPFNWNRVAKKIAIANPDLVVFHYWMPFFAPVYGFLARKIKKRIFPKMIAITHNLIPHEKQPGSNSLARYFLKPLDGVVTLSSSV